MKIESDYIILNGKKYEAHKVDFDSYDYETGTAVLDGKTYYATKVKGVDDGKVTYILTTSNNGICKNSVHTPIDDLTFEGATELKLLPDGYTPLTYIENSGTQRINTGLVPTNSTSIDITYQSMRTSGTSQYIAGSRTNPSTTVEYAINGSSGTTLWDVRFASQLFEQGTRTTHTYRSILELNEGNGSWTLIDLDTGTVLTKELSNVTVNATANLFLFAYNNADNNTHANLRILKCAIREKGVLVRNYIPATNNNSQHHGFYDYVNQTFVDNDGDSLFIAGETLQPTPNLESPPEIVCVGDKTKNLFDASKAENGTIGSTSGTNLGTDAYPNRCRSPFIYLTAGSYTISFKELISTGSYLHRYSSNNQDTWLGSLTFTRSGSVSTFTLTSDCYVRFTIQPIDTSSDLILNVDTLKQYQPQLEKGSTATAYEPYGYKIPIQVYGVNLAGGNNILTNTLISNADTGTIVDSTIYNTLYIKVIEGETYSFKGFTRADGTVIRGCFYDKDHKWVAAFTETTVVIPSGVKYVARSFAKTNAEVQFNIGEDVKYTPFDEPMTETVYSFKPLCSVNNVKDVFDYKNKKIIHNTGYIVYDGSDIDWGVYTSGDGYRVNESTLVDAQPVISNLFVNTQSLLKTKAIRKNFASIYCFGLLTDFPTEEEWLAYLRQNNLIVVGQLITPVEEEFSIPDIYTLDNISYIVVDTELEPTNMSISFYQKGE